MDMSNRETQGPFITCGACLGLATEAFEAMFVALDYGFKQHAREFEIEGCNYQNRGLYSRSCEHERKPRNLPPMPELDAMIGTLSA